ncbi:MAG TPA: DUF1854 domain-containing protein [Polyangiaceae bacterium]|nr:DUF1854 domain-containing protein [Polyangiaceae bacterium]
MTTKLHSLVLEKRRDGRLWALLAERAAPVTLRRCFPWTFPERYVSLQTEDNEELAFVANPEELDAASRAALSQALSEACFVLQIRKVYSVEEDFELRCFKVETPQGPRTFQTALDAWPRETPDGGLLIEDVAGDVFRIEDPESLDPRSRELVWELVD